MEYLIVIEAQPGALAKEINTLLATGWVPVGGVCLSDGQFVQALIRRAPREPARIDPRQARPQ